MVAMAECLVQVRPSHRVHLPGVQALRCPERPWLVVVRLVEVAVVVLRLGLLLGLADRQPPAHQWNLGHLTLQ